MFSQALASTLGDLGIGLLIAAGMFGLAVLAGKCIHVSDLPFEPAPQPETAAELDEWLALDGIEFEFKLCRRPTASVTVDGGLR